MYRVVRVLLMFLVLLLVVTSQSVVRVKATTSILYFPLVRKGSKLLKVGLVTDAGGRIDDNAFNEAVWQGVLKAEESLGVDGAFLESRNESDYTTNINRFISQRYDLIITVGFLMGDVTKTVAQAHPTQKLTIVDVNYDPILPNVIGQTFSSEQAAFLSGYLAAGMTTTGKVATFGGMNIPPVTQFMDGYFQGVTYYNLENDASVQVLGWNPVTKVGEFTDDFANQAAGLAMGQKLLGQGADIIFPVAGATGLGAALAVKAQANAWVIGVDTDWTLTAPDYGSVVLTSVMKNMGETTYGVIKLVYQNNFAGGNYVGTLANQGVGLGTISSSVPQALLDKVEQVKAAIIAGTIIVNP